MACKLQRGWATEPPLAVAGSSSGKVGQGETAVLTKKGKRTFEVISESRLSSYAQEANPRYANAGGATALVVGVANPHSPARVASGGAPRDLEKG